MKTVQWILFGAMVVAQLAVPFSMIASREQTLQDGTAYKFRCGPVDPYDYFRGRYVALSFPDTRFEEWRGERFERGDRAYALLRVDNEGFATITEVTSRPPVSGDYLEVQAQTWSYGRPAETGLQVTLPFNKYFMNEYDAPAAEKAYQTQSRLEEDVYVVVRLRDGRGVIEGLFIGDLPIEEYLRQAVAASERPETVR